MAHLTSVEGSLLSVVVGGAIGVAGTWLTQRRQARKARADARAVAVREAFAAADDLLAGVRLFRSARGKSAWLRGIATGIKLAEPKAQALTAGSEFSFKDKAALLSVEALFAMAPGGVFEQITEKDWSYFQSMVVPHRERLTAAVSSLRVGPDRALAAAADRLTRAGGKLADEASSRQSVFTRTERAFEARLEQFRASAQEQDH